MCVLVCRAQRDGIDTKAPIRPVTTAPLRSVLGKPEHELEDLRQKNYLLEEEVISPEPGPTVSAIQ